LGPGPGGRTIDDLERRVRSIHKDTGRRLTLVGWSLGGVLAREIAKRIPDAVRQVITLGSPISADVAASNVSWLYEKVAGPIAAAEEIEHYRRELQRPPSKVPSTAIFSKTDGIVHWTGCIEPKSPLTDNIEVYASHCGLGFNPFVFYAIADRLTMRKESWLPFDRGASAWRRWAFPSSGHTVRS
jgi:pimeloyl-ACP methyl ester carboxylesterase